MNVSPGRGQGNVCEIWARESLRRLIHIGFGVGCGWTRKSTVLLSLRIHEKRGYLSRL